MSYLCGWGTWLLIPMLVGDKVIDTYSDKEKINHYSTNLLEHNENIDDTLRK